VAYAEPEEEPARVRISDGLACPRRLGRRALPDADDPGGDGDAARGVEEVGGQLEAVRAVREPRRSIAEFLELGGHLPDLFALTAE